MNPLSLTAVLGSAITLAVATITTPVCGRSEVGMGQSGAPLHRDQCWMPAREIGSPPPGLDDAFHTVAPPAGRAPRAKTPSQDVPIATDCVPVSQRLADLDDTQRDHARVTVEPLGPLTAEHEMACARFARFWNAGQTDEALEVLHGLENAQAPIGVGINWQGPHMMPSQRSADVRIGDPRTDGVRPVLDYDADTGHLFSIVQWQSSWTVNISTDQGASWTETYSWQTGNTMLDIDAAVVDGYLYVAYVDSGTPATGRLRRCHVVDGQIDLAYGWQSVISGGADIVDVGFMTNADEFDNRIYYAAILADNTMQWHWDVATSGTTFIEDSPTGISPASGLDLHWNEGGFGGSGYFAVVSYIGADGGIHVLRHADLVWDDQAVVSTYTGMSSRTAVSAHANTIICAYEYETTPGQGIQYRITYNAGGTWNLGSLTTSSETGYFWMVDVTARSGVGTAVIFQHEVGEPDDVFFQRRAGYAPGPWDAREQINDFDVTTSTWTAINAIPHTAANVIETFSAWDGAAYIASFGEPNTATYGQTFVVDQPQTLYEFTVYLDDNVNPDFVDFEGIAGVWDTANSHIQSLFFIDTPHSTTNNGGAGGMEAFTFTTSGAALIPGQTYFIGIIATWLFDGETGTARVGYISDSNAYPYGQFVYLNNGSVWDAIYTDPFTMFTGDLAFQINRGGTWAYGLTYLSSGMPYFDREEGPPRCPEDLTDPIGVEQQDLNAVLNRWGDAACLPGGASFPCPEDLASPDGVEQQDLNAVLNRWGDPECE